MLPDPLARAAALAPERPALIAEEATLSYAALDAAASRAAGSLRSLGLQSGDRVGLLARNVPAAIVAVHAARRARLVLVPLHPRSSPAELAFALADAGVGLLLHDGATAAQAAAAVRDSSALALDALAELPSAAIDVPSVRLSDVQGIVYTSGTSSRPKGVVLTHGNHWWSAVG